MTTEYFMTGLFTHVDDQFNEQGINGKHPQAKLYVSEVITLGLLFALKGGGNRAFYRWLSRDYGALFPQLPTRVRLFRRLNTYQDLTDTFKAQPSLLGVIDTYGIERIHPRREGRSEQQIGRKGLSNQRWIVGGKLCILLNNIGLVVDWDCDTANVYDGSAFQKIVDGVADQMVVFADDGLDQLDWQPENLKVGQRGECNFRMLVETVLSMLTYVCHFKKVRHRVWSYFTMRLGFTMALFNILAQWHGLKPDENGSVPLSIAEFSL